MNVPGSVLRLLSHRYGVTLLVLLAVLALYGAADFSRPAGTAQAEGGGRSPIRSTVVACPAPGGARLSALSAPPPPSSGRKEAAPLREGRVDLTQTQGAAPVGSVNVPGTAWSQDVKTAQGSYTLRASGALAGGFEAEQTTLAKKGDDRGLAAVRCADPGTDLWFLGPGPADASHLDLYLTNVDDQAAAVDASALSDDGPLDTADGRGTIVEPHTTRVVPIGGSPEGLGVIVAQARLLALHVHVNTGRVAASVRVRMGKGKGVDWLPVTAPATPRLVVPGVPSGAGRRQLLIAVPGDVDARIKIQVITPAGAFAPQGQDTLDAPAGTVTPVDLERALSGKAAAVRLVADQPILGGLVVQQGDDVAYGAATPPLGGAAGESGGAVADNRDVSSVLLTAPDGPATVKLVALTAQGAAANPYVARVPGNRTLEVRLAAPPGATGGFGVMVLPQPGSGPVYASRVLTMNKLITIVPVVPAPTSVRFPPVADSLTSLIP
ncbi:DUF5719 family protein [Actinomadura scrupuli]|uniref:DUF5719 family protein n=1 Tax=Actinomadura scrupuli TaxID=559629 RepID=UPI003D983A8D